MASFLLGSYFLLTLNSSSQNVKFLPFSIVRKCFALSSLRLANRTHEKPRWKSLSKAYIKRGSNKYVCIHKIVSTFTTLGDLEMAKFCLQ
jgi:hypothetical protein